MERKEKYSDEVIAAASKLLDADMEMLHVYYPPTIQHCIYCKALRGLTRFDEECSALLRCALRVEQERNKRPSEPLQMCGICGGRMVKVRGRIPRDEDRPTCPTCATERLEQIQQISSREYGATTSASSPLLKPLDASCC